MVFDLLKQAHRGSSFSLDRLLDTVATEDTRSDNVSIQIWNAWRLATLNTRLEWVGWNIGMLEENRERGGLQPNEMERLEGAGQKAVTELRRIVPLWVKMILQDVEATMKRQDVEQGPNSLFSMTPEQASEWKDLQLQEVRAFLNMLEGLCDFAPRKPAYRLSRWRRKMNHWSHDAVTLFGLFESVVGTGSPSRNGPAVRFVKAAFASMGVNLTLPAIEQALRREKEAQRRSGR